MRTFSLTALFDAAAALVAKNAQAALVSTDGRRRRTAGAVLKALSVSMALVCGLAPSAEAALVSVTGGFTSFSGTVGSGQFVTTLNGTTVCPDAGCDQTIGTANVAYTTPVAGIDFRESQFGTLQTPNFVGFTPAAAQNVVAGDEFLWGTFTYTNGTWFDNPTFGFTLASVSADPTLNGHTFTDSLLVTITTNDFVNNTPAQNQDYISFVGRSDLGTFPVYELQDSPTGGNTGTIDLYGRIGSLIPTRFANPMGSSSFAPVPLPGAVWLLGSGLLGLVGVGRRKSVTLSVR
jgi:hypothetical protein